MNNNLYEFGGPCDVIIRCASERIIGGKTYLANEPYTILEDVYVDLQYISNVSENSAKTSVLASREAYPSIINIRGLTLTDKINDLIATRIDPQTIGRICMSTSNKGIMYLPEKAYTNHNIFVYDKNIRICDLILDESGEFLQSDSFQDETPYRIFYDVESSNHSYDLTAPHYGYFTIEIIGHGNTDKHSKEIYMKFPACSLMSTAIFNFINGNILNAPLQFECIYKNQSKPYFHIGN